MSKATFSYILEAIKPNIEKQDVVGDTIPPEKRLAVGLHRLTRGTYYYDLAEIYGIGKNFVADNLKSQYIVAVLSTRSLEGINLIKLEPATSTGTG